MKIIIDTNIALDVLLNRVDFFQASYDVLKLAARDKVIGLVTTSAVTDMFYVLRKNSKDSLKSKNALAQLLKLVDLADVVASDVSSAFTSDITDFEDAVVSCVAWRIKADYIITRNTKDFKNSPVPAVDPADFLEKHYSDI